MTIDYRERAERLWTDIMDAGGATLDTLYLIIAAALRSAVADATAEATERIAALEKERDALQRLIKEDADDLTAAEARADKAEHTLRIAQESYSEVHGTLATENKRLTEALRRMEWVHGAPDGSDYPCCIACGGAKPHHAPGCDLAAALAAPRPPDLIAGAPRTNVGALPDAAAQGAGGVVARSQEPPNAPTGLRPTPDDPARADPEYDAIHLLDTPRAAPLSEAPVKYPLPDQPPDGLVLKCPDCPHWASLSENAHAHRYATGHAAPTIETLFEARKAKPAEEKPGTPVDPAHTARLEDVVRLLCEAAVVQLDPIRFICPRAFEPAVRAAIRARLAAPGGERSKKSPEQPGTPSDGAPPWLHEAMQGALSMAADALIWASGAFGTEERHHAWLAHGKPALDAVLAVTPRGCQCGAIILPPGFEAREDVRRKEYHSLTRCGGPGPLAELATAAAPEGERPPSEKQAAPSTGTAGERK